MEIKLNLDTNKALKAAVAIATAYGLCHVSKGTKYPQLAAANVIALIIVIAILYGPLRDLFPSRMAVVRAQPRAPGHQLRRAIVL